MRKIVAIVHNVRSLHNVGSIFRTADAVGIDKIYLTGYTGTPPRREIAKVSLGAEKYLSWEKHIRIDKVITQLKKDGFLVVALEQSKKAVSLTKFKPCFPLAIIVGNEVRGLTPQVLALADKVVEIPMLGKKESLNVGVAFGIAAFTLVHK
jgi:tRNA G18 (ribose-2'-O)-methylase SpoU